MKSSSLTFEAFDQINTTSDELLEFIDSKIYALASPSIAHQELSGNLYFMLRPFFKKRNCKLYTAPIDVKLVKDGLEPQLVIPDLVVICDKSGLNDKRYEGVPTLVIEILSPSNQHHDLVVKMNLYAKFGIREYWIVDPRLQSVTIYALDETSHYLQHSVNKLKDTLQSYLFDEVVIPLDNLFDF